MMRSSPGPACHGRVRDGCDRGSELVHVREPHRNYRLYFACEVRVRDGHVDENIAIWPGISS